jgi:hypothetical protein
MVAFICRVLCHLFFLVGLITYFWLADAADSEESNVDVTCRAIFAQAVAPSDLLARVRPLNSENECQSIF